MHRGQSDLQWSREGLLLSEHRLQAAMHAVIHQNHQSFTWAVKSWLIPLQMPHLASCPCRCISWCPGACDWALFTVAGVPPYSKCHHAQPVACPSAVESCSYKMCAKARETVQPLTVLNSDRLGEGLLHGEASPKTVRHLALPWTLKQETE
jgi:hypothetical protein